MVQNSKVRLEEDRFNKIITLVDAVKINETIWFFPYYFNRLFVMNIKTKIVKYYDIPLFIERHGGVENFSSMVYIGEKIYLIPFYAQEILQFDILSEKFTSIAIDPIWLRDKKELCMGTAVYGKYLFLMGACVPVIFRINIMDNSIDYITDWMKKVEDIIFNKEDAFFRKQNILLGNRLYIPFCNVNAVLEIDCESMETVIHKLGEEKEGYSGICFSEGNIWLSPRYHNRLTKWNIKKNSVYKIELFGHRTEEYIYIGIIEQNGKKFLLRPTEGQEIEVDKKDNIYELKGGYDFVRESENILMYYRREKGNLIIYDKWKQDIKSIEIKIDENDLKYNNKIFSEVETVVKENNEINSSLFLKMVIKKDYNTKKNVEVSEKNIYNKLIEIR